MTWFSHMISYLFSMALGANACLFILQFVRIVRKKNADGVSLIAFMGFCVIQLVTMTHGFLHNDAILAYGTLVSLSSCTLVVVSIIYFQFIHKHPSQDCDDEPSLSEIIANIPANVYWINKKGVFLGCNEQMLDLLQLDSIEEYRGKSYKDLYEPEHIDVVRQTDQQVMKNDKAIALEEVAYPYKVYWSNKIPLHNDNNEVIGLLGVSIDITDRKLMEREVVQERKRAEDANQAKTEFIYNIRHDVRTPLTNMVGLTQILAERESDPLKQTVIDDLLVSSKTLLELLNDLLTFTNLEDNSQPIQLLPLNLSEIIQKVKSVMSAALRSKKLTLTIDICDKIPEKLMSDPMRIHRILLNLIGNALKFTRKGSVAVRCRVLEEEKDVLWVAIDIEDSGMGIPEDKLDYIFGKFNRIEQSANSEYPGSGLGLSIVKRFIEDLHGHIRVSSQVGRGSTFTCTIPFKLNRPPRGTEHEHATTCITN